MTLSFVIPAYNEAPNIDFLFSQFDNYWRENNCRVIFVNDGSTDGTLERLREKKKHHPYVSIVNLSRNFGKDQALAAGLSVLDDKSNALVMDADGQHSLKAVNELVTKYMANPDVDIFFGVRASRVYQSLAQRGMSRLLYKFLNFGSKRYTISNRVGDFFIARPKVVKVLKSYKSHRPFWKGFYGYIGYSRMEVLVEIDERNDGVTKFSTGRQFSLAADSLVANVKWPLRGIFFLGVFVFIISLIYLCSVITLFLLTKQTANGYYTLLSLQLFFGGITLISVGVIAEYVGMILDQVIGTPSYIIDDVEE